MNINDYQKAALKTANTDYNEIMQRIENGGEPLLRLLNGALGLGGEGGEVEDIVKKHVFQGHKLDKAKLCKELGDVSWYLAIASDAAGFPLEEVMQTNIAKLRARYPDGFSAKRSINREENKLGETWKDAINNPPKEKGLYYGKIDDTNSMWAMRFDGETWTLSGYPEQRMKVTKWAYYGDFQQEGEE